MKEVNLLIRVLLNEQGAVKSSHRPLTSQDAEEAKTWPSGGLVHLSQALFVEALRRDAYLMVVSMLSQGTKHEDLTPQQVAETVRVHWMEQLGRFGEQAAVEALQNTSPIEEPGQGGS